MSETRQPPGGKTGTAPPPPVLQRPETGPVAVPAGAPKGGNLTSTGPHPPQQRPTTPSASFPIPAPAKSPYQSQVVPPTFPHHAYVPGAQPPNGAPPAPGSSTPRLGGTGTLPSMTAAQVPAAPPPAAGPQHTGPFSLSTAAAPRITVQYPKVGATLTSVRGSYSVRDVIGSGEFGAVYECIGPFDQIYAVKMVRPANRPYGEVQAEWAREVQRLFSLRHPNVVYIYDSFEQGHLYFLALERCDHALKVMLGTPMQEGLVIEMTRQLLAAVQFLHDNDVVHDDLHAGNVLITHTDRPTVKISDFGISHELRGMPAIRPNVVHHAIMAPEILATGYTSKQSDLYQVGLLCYFMVVGEPAIQMDVPYQELVRQVSEGEPRKRAEALGTPLGNLIAKMLRRREAFRYTSAREVWADLRELPAWKQRNLFPAK